MTVSGLCVEGWSKLMGQKNYQLNYNEDIRRHCSNCLKLLCYHWSLWSSPYHLHHSLWTTVLTHSCLFLNSFEANLQYSVIIWFMAFARMETSTYYCPAAFHFALLFTNHCIWWRMARETWVQSQVESYQRLKKWYLMPPCLTLSIIRYGSRVK